jgi:AcrR family transcriptional regulator
MFLKNAERTETRRNDILDVAENLFLEKGYEHTTINDILAASGIAKGSLYYHYKSKEDVLDGIIKRRGDANIESAGRIARDGKLDARVKLLRAISSQKPGDERQRQLTADFEKSSNGQMFIKSLTDIVTRLAPILRGIVEQGISEGVFATPYPLESAEILLAAAHALFDNGGLPWAPEEPARKMAAFILAAERTLGAAEGSLSGLAEIITADGGK